MEKAFLRLFGPVPSEALERADAGGDIKVSVAQVDRCALGEGPVDRNIDEVIDFS